MTNVNARGATGVSMISMIVDGPTIPPPEGEPTVPGVSKARRTWTVSAMLLVALLVMGACVMAAVAAPGTVATNEDTLTDGPDPVGRGRKVTIVKVGVPTSRPVEILDARGGSVEDAIDKLMSGTVDGIVIDLPMNACDDTEDCAREAVDTCRLLGGRATAMTFSAATGDCSFSCSSGHAGRVACVTLPTRPQAQ